VRGDVEDGGVPKKGGRRNREGKGFF
jgi:hypothetical protein